MTGSLHLVVPAVPLTISASKSVQVDIPKSVSTVQVNSGTANSCERDYLLQSQLRLPQRDRLGECHLEDETKHGSDGGHAESRADPICLRCASAASGAPAATGGLIGAGAAPSSQVTTNTAAVPSNNPAAHQQADAAVAHNKGSSASTCPDASRRSHRLPKASTVVAPATGSDSFDDVKSERFHHRDVNSRRASRSRWL